MRILGFSKKWPKLNLDKPIEERPDFTTYRLPRRDRDWEKGEIAQAIYKPRSKDREIMGVVEIKKKETRRFFNNQPGDKGLTTKETKEAIEDGFISAGDMMLWMLKTHGGRVRHEPLNKLTLGWLSL